MDPAVNAHCIRLERLLELKREMIDCDRCVPLIRGNLIGSGVAHRRCTVSKEELLDCWPAAQGFHSLLHSLRVFEQVEQGQVDQIRVTACFCSLQGWFCLVQFQEEGNLQRWHRR